MVKVKKAQSGVGLRKGQYKRLGRIAENNPDRADKVADRMKERATREQRGKRVAQSSGSRASYNPVTVLDKMKSKIDAVKDTIKRPKAKNGKSFPDLNKDGKITKADILKGRGVIAKKKMQYGGAAASMKPTSKVKKAQAGKSIDSTGIYKKRAEDAGNKLLKDDVRNFGKNVKDFATKQADSKRYQRKGKPGFDEQGNRKPLSLKFKLRKGQAGLTASNKRVGPIDPNGAYTKVQEMNLPPRNVKTKVSLTKNKELGATKMMKMGGGLKPVDKAKNPGLSKLPTPVRNKMGYQKNGGKIKKK